MIYFLWCKTAYLLLARSVVCGRKRFRAKIAVKSRTIGRGCFSLEKLTILACWACATAAWRRDAPCVDLLLLVSTLEIDSLKPSSSPTLKPVVYYYQCTSVSIIESEWTISSAKWLLLDPFWRSKVPRCYRLSKGSLGGNLVTNPRFTNYHVRSEFL